LQHIASTGSRLPVQQYISTEGDRVLVSRSSRLVRGDFAEYFLLMYPPIQPLARLPLVALTPSLEQVLSEMCGLIF
jgi:hypothetical protein